MEEAGRSPKQVIDEFWKETYPKLPPEVQQRFERMSKGVTGLEPGKVIAVGPKGDVVARSWGDVYPASEAPAKVEHLEGPERGLVALMETANAARRDGAVAGASVPAHVSARMEGENRARVEGIWQRLMRAPAATKSVVAAEFSPEEAAQALDRLRAAPGSDPAAEAALVRASQYPTGVLPLDRVIKALENLKANKPGRLTSQTPLTLAWDGAIDLAITGIKAGRAIADVIKEAVDHFKAKLPNATADHVRRLEQAIRTNAAGREERPAAPDQTAPDPVVKHIETLRAAGVPMESVERDILHTGDARALADAAVAQHGEAGAVERAMSDDPSIAPGADTVLLTDVEKRQLDALRAMPAGPEQDAAFQRFTQFAERVGRRGTEKGRQVSFYNEVNRWQSPEGAVHHAVVETAKARDQKIGKGGREAVDQNVKTVNDINARAAGQVAAEPISGVKLTRKNAGRELKPGSADLDTQIKSALKDLGLKIRQVIRQHYTKVDALGETLAQKLVREAGLTGTEAATLAAKVQKRFGELTGAAKEAALEANRKRASESGVARVVRRKTLTDKLIEQSNLGALDSEKYLQSVAKDLKLPTLDVEQAAKLHGMAEDIQKAPEGFQRNQKIVDLLTELKRVEGAHGLADLLTSAYYAHILSGYTTQAVNIVSTAANTAADLGILAATHPEKLAGIIDASIEGLGFGAKQAGRTLRTGYSDKGLSAKFGAETGEGTGIRPQPTLEVISKDPSRNAVLRGYAGLMRYVGRGMSAADAVFYESAKSAFDYVAAARLAELEASGKVPRPEMNKRIRKLLGRDPGEFEQARTQARAEGLKGFDQSLRTAEILRQKRAERLGSAETEKSHQFALNTTFNNEPRGVLGIVANGVSRMSAKIPALKVVVPFTRVVANVTNASLNYSPLGLKRALAGFTGEGAPTGEERTALLVKGLAGTAGMTGGIMWALNQGDITKQPYLTGRGPDDKDARDQLRSTGWQPYSVKVGDKYLSYLYSPMALPAAIIGNLADKVHYDQLSTKEVGAMLASALFTVPETVTNMSFLQGLSQLMTLAKGGTEATAAAKNLVQSTAGSVIPNFIQQVDRSFDPTMYESSGPRGLLTSRIPGLRQQAPAQLTVRAQPVQSAPYERFGRPESSDEVAKVIASKQAWIPGFTRPRLGPPGRKRPATEEEFRQFKEESGAEINRRLTLALPRLRTLTPDRAKEVVDQITADAHARAREKLERESRVALQTAAR